VKEAEDPTHAEVLAGGVPITVEAFTVTVTVAHVALTHPLPSMERAKYVVVEVGAAMVLGEPVPAGLPPHEPVNHWIVEPPGAVAVRSIVAGATAEQKLAGEDAAEVGAAGSGFTVTVAVCESCTAVHPIRVARTLKVVEAAVRLPVGREIVPPLPLTAEPTGVTPVRSW
jgi:hypothetical protein